MGLERVRTFFRNLNMEERILIFKESSATVELAAKAIGCKEAEIAKTLAFDGGEETWCIVMAGDAKLDNKKFKKHFGRKAKMLPSEEVYERTGHEVGGVCPFALKEGVSLFLDTSLKRFSRVYPACGSHQSAIEITVTELENITNPNGWVHVSKFVENENDDGPLSI